MDKTQPFEKAIVIPDHNNGSLQHPDRLTILAVSLSAHESPHRHNRGTDGGRAEGRTLQSGPVGLARRWRSMGTTFGDRNGESHLPASIAPK